MVQIFAHYDPRVNESNAFQAWLDQGRDKIVMFDGAGRYAVGDYSDMAAGLNAYMAPDSWPWLEVDDDFYSEEQNS